MGGLDTFSSLILAGAWDIVSHNWALISILFTILFLLSVPTLVLIKYIRICLNILRDAEPPMMLSRHRGFCHGPGLCSGTYGIVAGW